MSNFPYWLFQKWWFSKNCYNSNKITLLRGVSICRPPIKRVFCIRFTTSKSSEAWFYKMSNFPYWLFQKWWKLIFRDIDFLKSVIKNILSIIKSCRSRRVSAIGLIFSSFWLAMLILHYPLLVFWKFRCFWFKPKIYDKLKIWYWTY